MVRRVAAAVFAVAVIAGALAIRNGAGGGDTASKPTQVSDPYDVFEDDSVTLLCAEELAGLCNDLEGIVTTTRVEPAWATVDRLADGGKLGADAWLTFRPFDQMAVPPAPAKSQLGEATVVGRSPIVLAGPPAAMAAAELVCRDPRTLLSCAGAVEGVQLMLRDPTTSPAGALALAVLADELGAPGPGPAASDGVADQLARLLARSRGTPNPYEDVARLQGSGLPLALSLEADVNLELEKLEYEALRVYEGVVLRYPFEARAAEIVLVPNRSFDRADDLVGVFGSRSLTTKLERTGFEVPGRARYPLAKKPFASRPSIRYDLPAPAPELLRRLRALPRPGSAVRVGP